MSINQIFWSRCWLLWGIAGIFLVACTQQTPPTGDVMSNNGVLNAGIHQQTLTTENGDLFRYTIAIPDGYDGSQPVPLILGLHYGGEVTPFYSTGYMMAIEPSLHDLGAIIIAPDSTAGQWTNEQAETAIFTLLENIEAQYNIDKERTLVMGYSMGGVGTWYIASKYQDYFTAALPMASRPQPNMVDIEWEIPLYVIHGRQDNVFPLAPTEVIVEKLQAQQVDITFVVLDNANHFDAGGFAGALQEATGWIQEKWSE